MKLNSILDFDALTVKIFVEHCKSCVTAIWRSSNGIRFAIEYKAFDNW